MRIPVLKKRSEIPLRNRPICAGINTSCVKLLVTSQCCFVTYGTVSFFLANDELWCPTDFNTRTMKLGSPLSPRYLWMLHNIMD